MRMTVEEFHRIRPLQWTIREFGNAAYNTTVDETETRLFWLDFIRNVWAPKFAAQRAVTSVSNFDVTQPVLLTNDLNLKLPAVLETVAYHADNSEKPKTFALPFSQLTVFIVGILAMISLLIVSVIFSSKQTSSTSYKFKIGQFLHSTLV